MGCNCRKTREVYRGPEPVQSASDSTGHTGGQPPIVSEVVVADARPIVQPQ